MPVAGKHLFRKRLFDIVVGSVLAVLSLPLIVLLAIGVACTLRCSPFFAQDRVGHDAKPFRFWKLRTLPKSAPAYADKYVITDLATPRFTRLLRQTHLDELLQLLLVPIGRMSLVGPRPEMPYLHAKADARFAEVRTQVRPGCTGLWQLSVHQHRLIWESPEYDLFYLRYASFRFDLWILWRTAAMMLHVAGPVALHQVPRAVLGRGLLSPAPAPADAYDGGVISEFAAR